MTRVFICSFLLALLLLSCGGKKQADSSNGTVSDSDTVLSVADSLEAIAEEKAPPKSADELFDDFLYSFTSNHKYQRQRVKFPLSVTTDGTETFLQQDKWKFTRLYMGKETYTVLYDNAKSRRIEKDTTLKRVIVDWLYLHKSRKKSFYFEKENGQWKLTHIVAGPLKGDDNADFFTFYRRFATDSLYASSHINDPLRFITYDEDTFQPIDGIVGIEQWFAFRPVLPHSTFANINYGQRYKNPNRRVLVICGVSNSMQSTLTFQRKGGKWLLTKFEE